MVSSAAWWAPAPVPLAMARSMLSLGIEASRAFWTASARAALPSMSPPPSLAATVTARASLVNSLPRRESTIAFLCLIEAHLECPDIRLRFYGPRLKTGAERPMRREMGMSRVCCPIPHAFRPPRGPPPPRAHPDGPHRRRHRAAAGRLRRRGRRLALADRRHDGPAAGHRAGRPAAGRRPAAVGRRRPHDVAAARRGPGPGGRRHRDLRPGRPPGARGLRPGRRVLAGRLRPVVRRAGRARAPVPGRRAPLVLARRAAD